MKKDKNDEKTGMKVVKWKRRNGKEDRIKIWNRCCEILRVVAC